jgi:hypothetical protein
LLLVTILLVLVAAVTLLIGIFSDNLALIFVSIGASALAAIVLAVLSQVSRRRGRVDSATTTAPEPLPARSDVGDRAAASIAATGEPVVKTAEEAPTEVVPVTSTAAPVAAATGSATAGAGAAGLAIADYDSLRVNEILPKLEGLDLDQLEDIAQHEEANKNRTTVLNRIDALMDEIEAGPGESAAASDGVAEEAAASIAEIGEPVVAVADTTPAASDGFPIPDYDALGEDEIIARLQDLDADQLETVADREEAGPNRDRVLDAIDDRLDVLEGIVPAASAPAPAPAKAAAPKKAPAKTATAKKAAATTTTARKAAATPAPAKKAASTTARKAAASAAPAKKAATTAKKAAAAAPAKKAAATTRKAPATTTAKKSATTVKKAAPVKKATAAKKATKR